MNINTIARYRSLLEVRMSAQERKVIVNLVRESRGKKFFVTDVKRGVRIQQTNQLYAILGQLAKKGILKKLGRAEYDFKDLGLVEHIKVQCLREPLTP